MNTQVVGVPIMAQQKQICLASMRMQIQSLASLSGLRIWRCHELWCRQTAVAPIGPLVWEPSYAMGASLKKTKNTQKRTEHYTLRGKHRPNTL